MEENKILKIVYTFFLGLLLAIFVGVGVGAFYEAPKPPEYPRELNSLAKEPSPVQTAQQQAYDKQMEEYTEKSRTYNRDVSIITLIAAVAFLVISLLSAKRMRIIADGIMLGGLFTLLYSVIRGFASEDSKYTFVAVSISLLIVLYLGYQRFTMATASKPSKRRVKA